MGESVIDQVRDIARTFAVTEKECGKARCFLLRESVPFAYLTPADVTSGRPVLWSAAPPGVCEEMVQAEPTRFFAVSTTPRQGRPECLATAETSDLDDWLGLYLDGVGQDSVDREEVEAILHEARDVVENGTIEYGTVEGGSDENGTVERGSGERSRTNEDVTPAGDFVFRSTLWVHAAGSWQFITLPKHISAELRAAGAHASRGFGSLRVRVTIGSTTWNTSVFPDSKSGTYLLPVKKAVRIAEQLSIDHSVDVVLRLAEA